MAHFSRSDPGSGILNQVRCGRFLPKERQASSAKAIIYFLSIVLLWVVSDAAINV